MIKAPPRKLRQRNDKYAKNIDKRGNVPIGKASQHDKEIEPPKHLVIIFFVLVVGSFFVQMFRLTSMGSKDFSNFSEQADAEPDMQTDTEM